MAIVIFMFVPMIATPSQCVYAEEEIGEIIDEELSNLDLNEIEEVISNLDEKTKSVFGSESFFDKLYKIISGDFEESSASALEYIGNILFEKITSFLPIVAIIIAISVFASMIQGLKPKNDGNSIAGVVNFVIYGIITIVIFSMLTKLIFSVTSTITLIKKQMDVVFPILLTLLTSVGGTVSVGVYQPTMAVLSSIIINIFVLFLLPLFVLSCVLTLINNLSNSVKLNKLIEFLSSIFKWTTSVVFTIFLTFASLQGLTAGSIDGLSIRTAKFTLKSYVPIVGSYVSDGIFIVLAGCNLIKNAVGACGLILLFATIISPLVEIIVFMLALKLISAVIEPMGDAKCANLVSGLSKNMKMLVAMIVSISFMYILLTGLVMCSANII